MEKIKIDKKNVIFLLVLIILLGLFLRIFAFIQISSLQYFAGFGDQAHYFNLAENILAGNGPTIDFIFQFWEPLPFGSPDAIWAPGFSYLLAFFFIIFGKSIAITKISVMAFSLASIPLVYLVGKQLFNEKVGLLSAFLLSIQPKHIEYSVLVMKDNIHVFFALAFFLFLSLSFNKGKSAYWAITGVFLALTYLTRYMGIVLIASFFLLCFFKRKKIKFKSFLISLLFLFIILAPWALYTYNTLGSPFFSLTKHYPYSNGWEGMSYQESAPSLNSYIKDNSLSEILSPRIKFFYLFIYYIPIWFTPLIFLFLIYSLIIKQRMPIMKYYTILLILAFLINFSAESLFIERGFFLLVFLSLPFISNSILHFSEKISIRHKNLSRKLLCSLIILLILVSSLVLLQWKLNDISSYNTIERQKELEKIGVWIKNNLPEEAIIMTTTPSDLNHYSKRRTIMDPYHFALSKNIEIDRTRIIKELNNYNVGYILTNKKIEPELGLEAEQIYLLGDYHLYKLK